MPTALFIPEEHNCCYRYSYSGALQTPAALPQLIIQSSICTTYTQIGTHTPHSFGYFGSSPYSLKVLFVSITVMSSYRQAVLECTPPTTSCLPTSPHTHSLASGLSLSPLQPPNHYAHNHLRGKENVGYNCMMFVTGAKGPPSKLKGRKVDGHEVQVMDSPKTQF